MYNVFQVLSKRARYNFQKFRARVKASKSVRDSVGFSILVGLFILPVLELFIIMAGMLPGVECARRRRFHQGGLSKLQSVEGKGRTRRPSFCLYTSSYDIQHSSPSSFLQRSTSNIQCEKLEGVAREAKERLDERLKNLETKRRSKSKTSTTAIIENSDNGGVSGPVVLGNLQTEVYGCSKKGTGGSKRFINWVSKFGWKALDQDECAVCLEQFETGQTLVHLPCAHRFHSRCLVPWLQTNAHCPCCRMQILLS